jgi:hypothetical protein
MLSKVVHLVDNVKKGLVPATFSTYLGDMVNSLVMDQNAKCCIQWCVSWKLVRVLVN